MNKVQSTPVVQPRVPPHRRGYPFYWFAVAAGLAVVVFLPLALAFAASIYFQVTGAILPGIAAGGVSVGGMTREQAAAEVDRAWNLERTLVVTDGARQWAVAPGYFGLRVDPAATVQAAYDVGRGPDAFSELVWLVQEGKWALDPVVVVDPGLAREQLVRWAPDVGVAPQNATIRLEGDQVLVTPGQSGIALDVDATLLGLLADPKGIMQSGGLPVIIEAVQPETGDVSAVAAETEALLSLPFKVTAFDPVTGEQLAWEADRKTVASWLTIETDENNATVTFDPALAGAYVESLAANLGPTRAFRDLPDAQTLESAFRAGQPVNLGIRYLPGEYTVQPGDTILRIGWKVGMPYWRVLRANPGLDDGSLVTGQKVVVPPLDELLPLPVVENKRIVISIGEQRMRVYENGNLIQDFVISTGIDRSPTQPGVYQILTHEISAYAANWDLTMPHFMGIYEAWPGFMNGIHGLPTLSNGRILWADVLGRPASYGCIILDLQPAEWLFGWAEEGVVVEVRE